MHPHKYIRTRIEEYLQMPLKTNQQPSGVKEGMTKLRLHSKQNKTVQDEVVIQLQLHPMFREEMERSTKQQMHQNGKVEMQVKLCTNIPFNKHGRVRVEEEGPIQNQFNKTQNIIVNYHVGIRLLSPAKQGTNKLRESNIVQKEHGQHQVGSRHG